MATNQEPVQEPSLTLALSLPTSSISPNDDVSKSPTKTNEPTAFYLFGKLIQVQLQEDSNDLNTKTESDISEDTSLVCKATENNEPKAFYLFGTRIQESSSSISTATLKRSRTMSLLGDDYLDQNPQEVSSFSTSSTKKDENPKEEDARKIKKTRHLSKEDDLDIPQRTITKTLTPSDVNGLSRLLIETSQAESYIMRYMSEDDQRTIQEGNGVKVKAYDHDTGTEYDMVFKRWIKTSRSYLFNGGWRKQFVRRRDLKVGDKIGLYWDDVGSKLHFSVLSRATVNQEKRNWLQGVTLG